MEATVTFVFGVMIFVLGVIVGRMSKREKRIIEIVGFERGANGRFVKAKTVGERIG